MTGRSATMAGLISSEDIGKDYFRQVEKRSRKEKPKEKPRPRGRGFGIRSLCLVSVALTEQL
jgi:hypothetical protein